jgi:hypothetical protein
MVLQVVYVPSAVIFEYKPIVNRVLTMPVGLGGAPIEKYKSILRADALINVLNKVIEGVDISDGVCCTAILCELDEVPPPPVELVVIYK